MIIKIDTNNIQQADLDILNLLTGQATIVKTQVESNDAIKELKDRTERVEELEAECTALYTANAKLQHELTKLTTSLNNFARGSQNVATETQTPPPVFNTEPNASVYTAPERAVATRNSWYEHIPSGEIVAIAKGEYVDHIQGNPDYKVTTKKLYEAQQTAHEEPVPQQTSADVSSMSEVAMAQTSNDFLNGFLGAEETPNQEGQIGWKVLKGNITDAQIVDEKLVIQDVKNVASLVLEFVKTFEIDLNSEDYNKVTVNLVNDLLEQLQGCPSRLEAYQVIDNALAK